jgi:hypothetical protein
VLRRARGLDLLGLEVALSRAVDDVPVAVTKRTLFSRDFLAYAAPGCELGDWF